MIDCDMRNSVFYEWSCARLNDLVHVVPQLLLCSLMVCMAGCQNVQPPVPVTASAPAHWTPEQQAALRKMGFTPHGDDWDLSLASSLLFEFDSDQLKREQAVRLRDMGQRLVELSVPSLRIEGHTDAVGDPSYNRELSTRRAAAVARVLATSGWARDRVEVRGLGQDRPIADNSTDAGRAQNRRVTLIAKSP